jgi:hypothetical protein
MATQPSFFYSNLFIAIATFVVGIFGLYLYHRRKQDHKRRSASIILLEIRNAESQLKDARDRIAENSDGWLPEHLYVMPSDSWSRNKHLFVSDFKPTEWDSINEFYDICQLFDEAIKHNDGRFAQQEKEIRANVHRATYKYAIEAGEKLLEAKTDEEKQKIRNEFFRYRDSAVEILTDSKYIYIYTANKQNDDIQNCLNRIDTSLSLTTVGTKLEKLSKNKLWIF